MRHAIQRIGFLPVIGLLSAIGAAVVILTS
jgi:hypothetical protein